MKNLYWLAALTVTTVLLEQPQYSTAGSIEADWWANRISSTGVSEFNGNAIRLAEGFTSGMVEGTIVLPSFGTWEITVFGQTDESNNIPSEYADTYFNNVFVDRRNNTPPNTPFMFTHLITDNQFDYRFEFSSPSTRFGDHLVVNNAIVTMVPEPSTLCCAGIAWLGLAISRRTLPKLPQP